MTQNPLLLQFIFSNPHKSLKPSFYYSALNYDIEMSDYFTFIGFDTSKLNPIDNTHSVTHNNQTNINFNRFYRKFNHRYEEYLEVDDSNTAVLPNIG